MPPSGWVIGCKGLRDPFRDAMFVGGREPKPTRWREISWPFAGREGPDALLCEDPEDLASLDFLATGMGDVMSRHL